MSRNSSGTYSLPAGNPVVSGTTIEASWANETLDDIATSLTNSLDRGGKGGMTASLKLADGTVSVPGMAFNNETNTGFYRAAAGAPRLAILGTDVMSFTRGFAQLFGFNDSADSEPTFTLLRGTSSPAANDEIGKFRFDSRNAANEVTEYAAIQATINDPADGSEGGGLELRTMQSGVVTSALTIDETGKVTIPGAFSSIGIDDNATSTAITIDSLENVGIGTASPINKPGFGALTLSGENGGQCFFVGDGIERGSVVSFGDDLYIQALGSIIFRTAGFSGGDDAMRIDSSRNLLIGSTLSPASAESAVAIFNGTAPTGSVTNGVVLYSEDVSASAELKVRDEAGNITTLSPHNFSLIPEGPSEEMAWGYYGEKNGKKINVDMLKLARMVERLAGEKLVYEE